MSIVPPSRWTAAQRDFVEKLREARATTMESSARIDRVELTPDELKPLISSGIVKNAGDRYYVDKVQYERPTKIDARLNEGRSRQGQEADIIPRDPKAVLRTLIFWVIFLLIPIILLKLFR